MQLNYNTSFILMEGKTAVFVSDVAIAATVSVVAVCLTVCVIGLLIYCHKNRKRFDHCAAYTFFIFSL